MRLIALLNHSVQISDADASTMARCIDSQLYYHAAREWGISPWRISYYNAVSTPPVGSYPLVLFDRPDVASALGYHDVDPQGQPYGKVFIQPILDAGGGILDGIGASVSATVSHEAIEMMGDAYANEWTDMLDGREVARELCDPVEADSYILRLSISGLKAQVSSYVTPAWFSEAGPGPYDHLGHLTAPFTMSPGGYLIVRRVGGPVTNVWGDKYPEWKVAGKAYPAARTARRMALAVLPPLPELDPAVLAAIPPPEEPLP